MTDEEEVLALRTEQKLIGGRDFCKIDHCPVCHKAAWISEEWVPWGDTTVMEAIYIHCPLCGELGSCQTCSGWVPNFFPEEHARTASLNHAAMCRCML